MSGITAEIGGVILALAFNISDVECQSTDARGWVDG